MYSLEIVYLQSDEVGKLKWHSLIAPSENGGVLAIKSSYSQDSRLLTKNVVILLSSFN